MKIAFQGPKKTQAALAIAPGSHCKSTAAALLCTFRFALPAGKYRATVDTYDQAPSHGVIPPAARLLSVANRVPAVVAAGKRTPLKLTLAGVPAKIVLTAPAAVAGTAFAQATAIDVDVEDPDGYTIVGPYEKPIVLADNDRSGATAIATSGTGTPAGELLASSDVATLSYTGLAIVPVTLSATVKGTSTTASVPFAPTLQPIVIVTGDKQNPSFAGVDMNQYGSGPGTGGTIDASEAGWTGAPYKKTFSATIASACGPIATFSPASGTSFTVHAIDNASTGECTVTLADGVGQTKTLTLAYTDYYYPSEGPQTLVIPAGVTSVSIYADGAAGGSSSNGALPGYGFELGGTFTFNPGDTLTIAPGAVGSTGGAAGLNGGGAAGATTAGSGGDAPDVRLNGTALANRVIVAGGGGGAGQCDGSSAGGNGGDPTGASGATDSGLQGSGGSQSSGGAGGMMGGASGALGAGGSGGGCGIGGGGGGGGGYYGGGGGGSDNGVFISGGGGGGGSSYISPSATNVQLYTSFDPGAGGVFISF